MMVRSAIIAHRLRMAPRIDVVPPVSFENQREKIELHVSRIGAGMGRLGKLIGSAIPSFRRVERVRLAAWRVVCWHTWHVKIFGIHTPSKSR